MSLELKKCTPLQLHTHILNTDEMGRKPCCGKGVIRGAWSAREDEILINYIKVHGEGKWRELPRRAGLRRCGKSCRLRWLNYLRPDIKRGNISEDEEDLIIRLHKLLGNRWTLIAGRLPGRTDNEIKNYWNTILSKRVEGHYKKLKRTSKNLTKTTENQQMHNQSTHEVICPTAVRCRNSKLSLQHQFQNSNHAGLTEDKTILLNPSSGDRHNSSGFLMDFDIENDMDFDDNCYLVDANEDYNAGMAKGTEFPIPPTERVTSTCVRTETWSAVADSFEEDDAWDLEAIASFLITEAI